MTCYLHTILLVDAVLANRAFPKAKYFEFSMSSKLYLASGKFIFRPIHFQ